MVKKTNKEVYGNPTSSKPQKMKHPAVYYRKDALGFMMEQNLINKAMIGARHQLAEHVFRMLANSENAEKEQQAA